MSETYENLVKDVDAYYRMLFKTGWIDEWADSELNKLRKGLADTDEKYRVLGLSEYSLDPEGFHDAEDYKGLLISLFRSFDIELTADKVAAADDGGIKLSVQVPSGKVIVYSGIQEDDWFCEDFLDFINDELLPEWHEERMFFVLPPAEAQAEIVFQYPEVIDSAIENGVIPADDYFARFLSN